MFKGLEITSPVKTMRNNFTFKYVIDNALFVKTTALPDFMPSFTILWKFLSTTLIIQRKLLFSSGR